MKILQTAKERAHENYCSDLVRQLFTYTAADYAADFNANLSASKEAEVLDELKADGVNVVEVEDKTPWQDAVKDVVANAIKGNEDLYQKILDCDK